MVGFSFFLEHGWIALLELCFVLVILGVIHRNKEALSESEQWKFLAERPVSSALFINILTVALFVAYTPYSDALRLTNVIVGGIASMRVLGLVLVRAWRKQAVYWLMGVYIVSEILVSIGLPNPLARLYIFLVSLMAIYLLMRWIKQSVDGQRSCFSYLVTCGSPRHFSPSLSLPNYGAMMAYLPISLNRRSGLWRA